MSTIAAISTAPANGGIGIIRMSGKDCFEILNKIFVPKQKQNIEEISGYTIKYGYIIDFKTKQKIDEVLVSFFRKPKSYTTENMCEINSHGGNFIVKKILELCNQYSLKKPRFHFFSSSGALRAVRYNESLPLELQDDLFRIGIAFYGYLCQDARFCGLNVKPIASLWAKKISTYFFSITFKLNCICSSKNFLQRKRQLFTC